VYYVGKKIQQGSKDEKIMARHKGALITVVLCKCGHMKLMHLDSCYSGAECHGACAVSRCGCDKFTWTHHTETMNAKDTDDAWRYWGKRDFQFL